MTRLNENYLCDNQVTFKYFPIILTLFIGIFLSANITAVKLVNLLGFTLTAACLIYPFTYLFNIVIVEVYGYKNARLSIWCGFLLCLVYLFSISVASALPTASYLSEQNTLPSALLPKYRVIIASLLSYFLADFSSSYLAAKMKVWSNGTQLFRRSLLATLCSVSIGVVVFIGVAFYSTISNSALIELMSAAFVKKLLFQILLLPLAVLLAIHLKRVERIDIFDRETEFTPFSLENSYISNSNLIKDDKTYVF